MIEEWRPFPEHEARYEISSYGRVRSVGWTVTRLSNWGYSQDYYQKPKNRKPGLTTAGYLQVVLMRDGRKCNESIHRAVLIAFIGPSPGPAHQAAHGDGDRQNNRLENLRWATPVENTQEQLRHGTRRRGLTVKQVIAATEMRRGGMAYREIAAKMGISSRSTYQAVNRELYKDVPR